MEEINRKRKIDISVRFTHSQLVLWKCLSAPDNKTSLFYLFQLKQLLDAFVSAIVNIYVHVDDSENTSKQDSQSLSYHPVN